MKKTFANLVQKSLVAALLVLGMLLVGTTSAEAQSSSAGFWPTSWVDAGEAMLRLKADVQSLSSDPQVYAVGSDSYIRVHCYKAVYRRLDGGEPIQQAIINSVVSDPTAFVAPETIPGVLLSNSQKESLMTTLKNRLSL